LFKFVNFSVTAELCSFAFLMSQYDVLKTMVARVARAFYDPKYIVVLDALNKIGEQYVYSIAVFVVVLGR
jgi:hypothetical protein